MLCSITTIKERTQRGLTTSLVWTKCVDLTRVKNLHKSTKWMDPTRDQDSSPQSGRTQQGSKTLHKSTRWMEPTRDQNSYPQSRRAHKGQKLTQVHKVDGPHERSRF